MPKICTRGHSATRATDGSTWDVRLCGAVVRSGIPGRQEARRIARALDKSDPNAAVIASARRRMAERSIAAGTGCLLWTGSLDRDGYGRFSVRGRTREAHRVAWELARGPIPDGLVVDHLCRTRHCINPEHLELVTGGENVRRGRAAAGLDTHCKHGHEYTEANTSRDTRGRRVCRECARIKAAAYYQRAKRRAA